MNHEHAAMDPAFDDSAAFARLLALRPELQELYEAFYAHLWDAEAAPRRTLELARLRIAQLHGCTGGRYDFRMASGAAAGDLSQLEGWRDDGGFSAGERAALTIAEKMPWRYHEITDAEVAALRAGIGEPALVAFVVACAQFDAICRLNLVFEALADEEASWPR